ncbi:MAG: ABC transporter permease [Acidimicrobiia bacterium]|nr:ABC transporter permease [Acidimicrobiia bacterium]
MSFGRAWKIAARELRLGPRSPVFIWVLLLPLAMSFLISAVFGGLLDPDPRLGIVDLGSSEVTVAARELEGISVSLVSDAETLRDQVEAHDLDAGFVLAAGFDEAVRSGDEPELDFYISGESLASSRAILAVTTTDLVRGVGGQDPPVSVAVTPIGDEDFVPIGDRLLPIVVYYAVVMAALFLPASSILDEREKHTLDAVLVTPTTMREVLVGKGILGVLMGVALGVVSLALNQAMGERPLEVVLFLLVGSIMMAELGLILGSLVKDANSLYTAIKAGGVFIALPVIFIIWPTLPQWISKLAPTYYFLQPVYDIAVNGMALSDFWLEFAVACLISLALAPILLAVGRRAEIHLAWAA